jgi:GNAT superfamily N-acetyltransferase
LSIVFVEPLRHHCEFVSELARRFEQEWPEWYGPSGTGNATQDLSAFANPEGVFPVGVIALSAASQLCGIAALKAKGIAQFSHLSPWAAAGYVLPELRGRGIGAALVGALLVEARRLGYDTVYCATSTAGSLLQREGWQLMERTVHDEKPICLFRSPSAASPFTPEALQRASPASAVG